MSKNSISIIIFLIILTIFLNAFSDSYTSHNINNLAYVLALGIDVGEEAKMKISAQFSKTAVFSSGSGSSSDDSSNIVLVSGEADSIFSGLNLLNSYIGKELNLAHCSVVIFSEEFAKNGISTEIYSLINNEEIRPSTNLVVSKCSAYDYLNNANPNLEKLTTNYYDTFSITSRFTGYISNITIGNFFNDFSAETTDCTAILGGLNSTAREEKNSDKNSSSQSNSGQSSDNSNSSNSSESSSNSSDSSNSNQESSSNQEPQNIITNPEDLTAGTSSVEGKRGSENIGLAVFDEDKLCGELTALESICHLLIVNDVDSCIVSIDNPMVDSKKMELQLFPSKKSKISIDIIDNVPHIYIDIKVDADIFTLEDNIDYSSDEVLEKISITTEQYLEKEFRNYLNKVSKEYGIDIDHFSTKAFSHFSTVSEWKEFNWTEKYKNSEFDVSIDVDVMSSLLITKT